MLEKLPKRLKPSELYTGCDLAEFKFETTDELNTIELPVGQDRALGAVRFGIRIGGGGYNLFAMGPPGLGKRAAVRELVTKEASDRPVPADWCYVNDFSQPQRPRAISLPPGRGAEFSRDMDQLVEDLRSAVPASFESEDYRNRVEEMDAELKERQSDAFRALQKDANDQGVALLHTPAGFAFAPVDENGETIAAEEFNKLDATHRQRVKEAIERLQERMQSVMREFPIWAKETREKIKQLNREIASFAVGHLIDALRGKYSALEEVLEYLEQVEMDVIDNVGLFSPSEEGEGVQGPLQALNDPLRRYRVNLVVDNGAQQTAPIIFEELPSLLNLIGRIEHEAHMGTLFTDFTLIRPGALHRANGGFLLLDAQDLLMQPFAWDGLKRALKAQEIRIESPDRMLSLISTVSLEPESIPLDLKVVLVGERVLYYLLQRLDPEFMELFKVVADFDDAVDRTPDNHRLHASLCATIAHRHRLKPLDKRAVGRFVERAARLADDGEKLTTHLGDLVELLREADHWAAEQGRKVVDVADLERAIEQQTYRVSRVRERIQESMRRGILLIDTSGERVGQINGLSVMELGRARFGQPVRITATTRLGDGKVIDIQRETDLGGAIHSKGVMILAGYLNARYAVEAPLSMAASLVFEQSYGMVEGDSASVAELCALLSALSAVSIRQSLAVTGSVNQHGDVQAIGGVNEKIEGFFDVCQESGLCGDQGVVVPASNVKHLMLRRDVIDAVEAEQFNVFAVETVDQAISLLMDTDAGERDAQGRFPSGSVNARVEAQLMSYAAARRNFASRDHQSGQDEAHGPR